MQGEIALRSLRPSGYYMNHYMKRYLIHITALLMFVGSVFAEDAEEKVPSANKLDEYMESGMEVSGVRAPYYDDDGNLKAQLYGGHARILDGQVADITNLRIDVYEDGNVFMTVFAPQCFTKMGTVDGKKILIVYSEGEVLLDMAQVTIAGKGFRFTSAENRFELLHESKVLVKEAARDMKGVDL